MKRILLALVLAVAGTLLLLLPACSSPTGWLPATQDQVEQQIADAQEYQMMALEEAGEGDLIAAGILYLLSTISGVSGAIGLSKIRRKSVDSNLQRLADLKKAEAVSKSINS